MGAVSAARRRHILRHGASCQLRRQTAVTPAPVYTSVTLRAVLHGDSTGVLRDGWREGDRLAEILTEEIAASAWPAPPRPGDTLVTPDGTLTVVGPALALREAATVCGWRLHVRGP